MILHFIESDENISNNQDYNDLKIFNGQNAIFGEFPHMVK